MKYTRQAIETRYASHLFRSRLEARWAAWFDLVDVIWTYEPFDALGYIPDFLCRDSVTCPPYLIEVKGLPCDDAQIFEETTSAFDRVFRSGRNLDTIVVGCDPDFRTTKMIGDNHEFPFADGLVGAAVTALYPSQLAELDEAKRSEDTRILSYFDYLMTGRPVTGGHVFRLVDVDVMQPAWGQAHEIARWMPVAVG